jgi:hypothetical protein
LPGFRSEMTSSSSGLCSKRRSSLGSSLGRVALEIALSIALKIGPRNWQCEWQVSSGAVWCWSAGCSAGLVAADRLDLAAFLARLVGLAAAGRLVGLVEVEDRMFGNLEVMKRTCARWLFSERCSPSRSDIFL